VANRLLQLCWLFPTDRLLSHIIVKNVHDLSHLIIKFTVFTTSNSLAEGVTAGASLVYRDAAHQKRPRAAALERWAILSAPG